MKFFHYVCNFFYFIFDVTDKYVENVLTGNPNIDMKIEDFIYKNYNKHTGELRFKIEIYKTGRTKIYYVRYMLIRIELNSRITVAELSLSFFDAKDVYNLIYNLIYNDSKFELDKYII